MLIDESGFFLNPLVRRTWAMKGHTPKLMSYGRHRDKVSTITAIAVSPKGRRIGLFWHTNAEHYIDAAGVVAFLRSLLEQLSGRIIIVWDGGSNHKGPLVREYLRRNRRLRLELLPPWAPDHNPVEAVWSWLKYGELANYVPEHIPELDDTIVDRLIELKFDPGLLKALWDRSKLPFPEGSA